MGKKNKVKTINQEVIQVKSEVKELIPFSVFFYDSLSKGLVKPWQLKEIYTFFRDLGLSDKEPKDKYEIALKKY